jgi:gliding motility-associated lipoprotein GldD
MCYKTGSIALLLMLSASCRPDVYPPKPAGYFRIDTPGVHKYQLFDRPGYPYSFEYPVYSTVEDDTSSVPGKGRQHPYWINIEFPRLGAAINITYKEISAGQPLGKLVEDSWGLSFVHHEKADYMDTRPVNNPYGTFALLYIIGGNSASRYQFVASDSVKHFIRGALYFDVTPNADSLKPATDFLEQDIERLLETLKWKTN